MIIVEIILLLYFIYVVAYTTFFSVAAFFYHVKRSNFSQFRSRQQLKFCFLIPAYKEDAVIVETTRHAVGQLYPVEKFEVIVIADQLKPSTILELNQLPVRVEKVSFAQSTKVNSLRTALQRLAEPFDYAIILDADNTIDPDFLERINSFVQSTGHRAVQVTRQPKNKNNHLSYLDGVSESINTRIFRQGTSAVGLSASISGSGVIVDFILLKHCLSEMNAVGGFDRELEIKLLQQGVKVHYFNGAHVNDEKVSESKTFQGQRRRWISSQYFYLKKYFAQGVAALLKGDFVFFNSTILRNVQLPRLINLGLLFCFTLVLFPFRDSLFFTYSWWPYLLSLNVFFTLLAVPREYYTARLFASLVELPLVFFKMVFLLFRVRGANKTFIHTPHSINSPQ